MVYTKLLTQPMKKTINILSSFKNGTWYKFQTTPFKIKQKDKLTTAFYVGNHLRIIKKK
ncbi:hypothetical protein [Desulfurobacterium indicum]|uniref:hypothetical protein n=1 Tax=Desulfurobacterium indicum TaxID=1914305 RepID=UPI0013018C18|nr:hypothetical protein [Desulfurobacterium indicum]